MKKTRKKADSHGGKRKGAGRPAKFGEGAQYVTCRLPSKLIELLDRDATESNRSRNDVIVAWLCHAYHVRLNSIPPEV